MSASVTSTNYGLPPRFDRWLGGGICEPDNWLKVGICEAYVEFDTTEISS